MIDLYLASNLPEWHLQAECRGADPTLFFPGRGDSTRKAKAMCTVCVVQPECLTYAIDNRESEGIWGGLSIRDRRAERRRREAA